MSRLLFCWELGANFGHLTGISGSLAALRAAGHDVSLAVADLRSARQLLGAEVPLIQAPVWPSYTHRGSRIEAASFADVLALVGFADLAAVAPVVDAWRSLFSLVGADLIIADHSPAAQLAARTEKLKLITTGTGFTQPPLEYPNFPPLRVDIAPAIPERQLLKVAQRVLSDRGVAKLVGTLPELFAADARIVVGLPELDPYRSFRRERLAAPPGGFPKPVPPTEVRVFAYLGSEMPGLEEKVQALCDLPFELEIYIRGGDELLCEFVRLRGKTAHTRPVNIGAALRRASHVISQGGAMFASEALSAGRPHLFIPLHREAQINAAAVVRNGYGRELNVAKLTSVAFSNAVSEFVADGVIAGRAMELANMLQVRPMPDAGVELVNAVERLT